MINTVATLMIASLMVRVVGKIRIARAVDDGKPEPGANDVLVLVTDMQRSSEIYIYHL